MNRLWIVASYEFWTNIRKRSFLFALFGLPLMMMLIFGVVAFVTATAINSGEVRENAIGYVDTSGILADEQDVPEGWQRYATLEVAQQAYTDGTIDAYFVTDARFLQTGNLTLSTRGTISEDVRDTLETFITEAIVASTDSALPTTLLENPAEMTIVLTNTGRILTPSGFLVLLFIPIIFMVVFMMGLQISSSFLMSGVVEEKSNRVIELLITSVSPYQLLGGKLIGLGILALIQLGVWLGVGVIAYLLTQNTEALRDFVMPWDVIGMAVVYFVLTYFFYGSLLAGIGALVDSEQESRQYAGIISLALIVPIFALSAFLSDPSGTVPTVLSYIPFTSGLSMCIRAVFGAVTASEILLSMTIMVVSTLFVVWASAKVFKWALLLYGKKFSPRDIWRVVRGRTEMGGVA